MLKFLSLVQRPQHSVRVKPQSWEYHGLKRWIEAARKRLHRKVLAIAYGRAANGRKFESMRGEVVRDRDALRYGLEVRLHLGRSPGRLPAPDGAFLENRHPSARIPTHP
jgi:hypothetical protein